MLTEKIAVTTSDEAQETFDEARERMVSPAPVLISEQEVVLGTAVALRAQPTTRRRWFEAVSILRAAMRRPLARSTREAHREARPVRRDYPKRYAFLENGCMAREMDRL
ncbi:hypothetical protein [Mycobacterium sp.]|uniref:hypothetical protein n=1 Tax=Mycobacterium sp. TaxID=1785 RepID=UPI003BB08B5C